MDKKNEFLYAAISDAQELIRFSDTKTAVVVTILGAYIVSFFTAVEVIIKYSWYYSCLFWLSLFLFLSLIILCVIVMTRIIKPTNNPIDNIHFGSLPKPNLNFFLTPNDYSNDNFYSFYNSKKFKLKENYEIYIQKLIGSNDDEIIKSLTVELLKVSYIRNIKNDRFHILLWLVVLTTISFFVFYFTFRIETQQTIDFIETMEHCCCS